MDSFVTEMQVSLELCSYVFHEVKNNLFFSRGFLNICFSPLVFVNT
jgi:hypothetical protein